jgi:mersacidin/lichenicidin family type 2 lantibiotic
MNTEAIVRAWKDPSFRASLTTEQRAAMPENPSGKPVSELDDSELEDVTGGIRVINSSPMICCTMTLQPACKVTYVRCVTRRVCLPTIIEPVEEF